ncbi:glutaryl-CoA dehydrogenase [Agromyces rhizosphaerae]|uniref:Glutaryl-CoA dehydrogenase n=1 Tax=Agromyces rhizosphaerae TaxID=88374 RepID=A0A9W6CYC6_9MICO|nr:acyl-CoA dehydrogenase family protein [Agromyces rhizosphaerae]GLI27534.1 glutaryl-CoA dehydrogenase [Agromyces rhizosphaerae]
MTDQMTTLTETPLLAADFYGFQSTLTPEEQASLGRIRAFLEGELKPIADEYWDRAESAVHLIPRFAELGVFGAAWPETRQFENSELYRAWVALEIARVDPSSCTLVGVHNGLGMTSIAVGGSEEQKAEWMGPMARGEVIGAFGLTEPGHGSDTARGLETTATRRGDEWVLNGAKRWIGNATFADMVIIWARDTADDQVKGFIVRTPAIGFTATKIERKQSLRGVQNADIVLEDVVVPERDRLQRIDSFRDLAVVLRLTRAGVAWQAIGVAVGAYEAALAYSKERVQFGKPIASYQLTQEKLATALSNITASIAMCVRLAEMEGEGEQHDHHSAMAKAFTTKMMRETVALCREIAGGNGIQLDHGLARFFADAEAVYTFEGTYDMNQLIVGRAITGIAAFR